MIQSGDKIIQAMEKSTMSDSENSAGSGKNLIYCVLELVKGWVEKNLQILHSWPMHLAKGQIKSEWIYEVINFPKNEPKNFEGFQP